MPVPAPVPVPPQRDVPAAETGPAAGHAADLTVLVIEDDPASGITGPELSAAAGTRVRIRTARNLTEAGRLLTDDVDCILLDLALPVPSAGTGAGTTTGAGAPFASGGGGDHRPEPAPHRAEELAVLTHVLRIAPLHAVLVLTAQDDTELAAEAVRVGAQDYLFRGELDARVLSRAIRYAVERKRADIAQHQLTESGLRAQENARLERGLLPVPLLRDGRFHARARYEPGRVHGLLSGDFYDVVQTADGAVHAVIGDVSGHGAAEAALGVCLRVAWRTAVLCGTSQLEQIELLEEILVAKRSDAHVFATMTSLSFTPDGRGARIVRAGHPGLLLRRGDEVHWVEPEGGMALGLLPGMGRWTTVDLPLVPGDGLVLFTDGLFEGRDGPDSRLGEEGLLAMARALGNLQGRQFVDALVAGAAEGAAPYGGLADDVAVLHLGWGSELS